MTKEQFIEEVLEVLFGEESLVPRPSYDEALLELNEMNNVYTNKLILDDDTKLSEMFELKHSALDIRITDEETYHATFNCLGYKDVSFHIEEQESSFEDCVESVYNSLVESGLIIR